MNVVVTDDLRFQELIFRDESNELLIFGGLDLSGANEFLFLEGLDLIDEGLSLFPRSDMIDISRVW